jgi:hypothetical protein
LKPLREDVDEPNELRYSHNPLARKIADVNTADDRRHVVLAMRFEPDVAQQNNLIVAGGFFKGPLQILARILEITRKPLFVCTSNASGCSDEPFAIGIIARPPRTASSASAREGRTTDVCPDGRLLRR